MAALLLACLTHNPIAYCREQSPSSTEEAPKPLRAIVGGLSTSGRISLDDLKRYLVAFLKLPVFKVSNVLQLLKCFSYC